MRLRVRLAALILLPAAIVAQEAVLPVPPTVVAEGVPPVPMSLVERVAPYGMFRRARMLAWHPTERRILISTTFANNQIHEVTQPGAARNQLTFFRDGVLTRPPTVFLPSGRAFVFQKDTANGAEVYQLFRYDLATGTATQLTDGKSRNGAPVVSPSGLIAYDSTRRNGKDRDIYVMDPADPRTDRLVAQTSGAWAVLDWSADEKSLLAVELLSSSETYLWRVSVADGRRTPITERTGTPVRWVAARFGNDGRSVFGVGNREAQIFRLWKQVGTAGTWTLLSPPDVPLEDFALSPDGRTIAVVLDKGGASELQLLGTSGRMRARPSLPPGTITDLVWHPKGNELAFSLSGARTFHDVYSVNAATGNAERWTWSEIGGANPESLPDAELAEWKSFDGQTISGWLYRPPARFTGPRPVIINVHGGPAERERPRGLGRSNYFRNEMGIAIIYPNIRGSVGFGSKFEQLDNGRQREDAIKDIGALLDWIARDPSLDKSRVMIVGASYGGYVALASAIAYGDRLRCVQAAAAITDFPTYLESTEMSRQADRNSEYGDASDAAMREYLKSISPLTHASKLKIPLYLVHGAKDTRIPVAQADMLAEAVKAHGTPIWYVVYKDAGHLIPLNPVNNDYNQYTWTLFVQKYLLQ
jgi:dipeptidyl aminopeptidase/acylaminoacyl peptidase